MKKEFVVFYSWMSDRPNNQNRKYIRKILDRETNKLGKELGISIIVDSDSRGEDGSKSIDDVVIKKIANCDLFIGDITPVNSLVPFISRKKLVPNPNVQYELGFAVASLGWNRCILVWNSKYGDVNLAPFDIRNHTTVTYRKGKSELSLYGILKTKIENYEQYIKEWRTGKERSFDAEKYNNVISICSERDLLESIRKFLNHRVYNGLEFKWWDKLIYDYTHYPDNKFVDDELHESYMAFLKELNKMIDIATIYNVQTSYCYREDIEVGSDEWDKEQVYGIRDPFQTLEEHKAYKMQDEIDHAFLSLCPYLFDSYTVFRDLVRKKLLL